MKLKRLDKFSDLYSSVALAIGVGASSANSCIDRQLLLVMLLPWVITILGTGITATNFVYTGAATASWYILLAGTSSWQIGIDQGIILTSG